MQSANSQKNLERCIALRINAEELAALNQFSEKHGINRATVVRIAVRKLIEKPETLIA